jgi:sialidase-1
MIQTRLAITILIAAFAGSALASAKVDYQPNRIPVRIDLPNVAIGFVKTVDKAPLKIQIGGDRRAIAKVALFPVGAKDKGVRPDARPVASVASPGARIELTPTETGKRYAIAVSLKPNTNLLSRFTVSVAGGPAITYRPAVKVRHKGDDNSKGYRIPGLVTTKAGTLLGCYDVRFEGMRDLQGHMDIGISRSTDGGQSWEPMRIALDMGEFGGLPQKYNGVSDANLIVDDKTGRIYCFGLWMHGTTDKTGKWLGAGKWIHQWHTGGSNPGFEIKGTSQFMVSHSDDDGKTWSKPENLTRMVKRKAEWNLYAPAPGNGITLRDGTLVVPTQGKDAKNRAFSTIMVSKDRGKTWRTGHPANDRDAGFYANECAVVELPDGSLMLNARDPSRKKYRGVFITKDLGETWTRHATSNKALIEPTCMASLISRPQDDKQLLLFSNPNTKTSRTHMTIQASLDNGNTWPEQHQLLLDQRGGAYSSLTNVDANTIGILYESSQAMLIYQRLTLAELLSE